MRFLLYRIVLATGIWFFGIASVSADSQDIIMTLAIKKPTSVSEFTIEPTGVTEYTVSLSVSDAILFLETPREVSNIDLPSKAREALRESSGQVAVLTVT